MAIRVTMKIAPAPGTEGDVEAKTKKYRQVIPIVTANRLMANPNQSATSGTSTSTNSNP
jgi:hypothetical protein